MLCVLHPFILSSFHHSHPLNPNLSPSFAGTHSTVVTIVRVPIVTALLIVEQAVGMAEWTEGAEQEGARLVNTKAVSRNDYDV